MKTLTVDSHNNTFNGSTLFVIEQKGLDVLDAVSIPAVRHADGAFTPALRAEFVLIHDRQVGVVVSRRTLHALYRSGLGRNVDSFGNTFMSVATNVLLERPVSPAELVNIDFVAGPIRQRIPALPELVLSSEATSLTPTLVGVEPEASAEPEAETVTQEPDTEHDAPYVFTPEPALLDTESFHVGVGIPEAHTDPALDQLDRYQALLEQGVSDKVASRRVWGV